eukprot:895865-Rhodomonas_salina.1
MKYCAHKNDLLLCVNRPLFKKSAGFLAKNAAYPYVLSTLGGVSEYLQHAIAAYYALDWRWVPDEQVVDIITEHAIPIVSPDKGLSKAEIDEIKKLVQRLPSFTFMGYSLGLAYAHPSSGDNIVSAMVGGMLS